MPWYPLFVSRLDYWVPLDCVDASIGFLDTKCKHGRFSLQLCTFADASASRLYFFGIVSVILDLWFELYGIDDCRDMRKKIGFSFFLCLQNVDPQTQTLRELNDFVFRDERVSSSMVRQLWTTYILTLRGYKRCAIRHSTFFPVGRIVTIPGMWRIADLMLFLIVVFVCQQLAIGDGLTLCYKL